MFGKREILHRAVEADYDAMKIKYEKHPREYTVLGPSVVFDELCSRAMGKFLGNTFREIIVIVKDGVYYHFQREGERERITKKFLSRIKKGIITKEFLDRKYKEFDRLASEYENLIYSDQSKFSKKMLVDFLVYYRRLIYVGYICQDLLNIIDQLSGEQRQFIVHWAEKARRREEVIYKNGEMKFLPRYLSWFAKNEVQGYTAKDLRYLIFPEMEAYLKEGKPLPTAKELRARRDLLYIRHSFPSKLTWSTGKEAERHIIAKGFFGQQVGQLEMIKELKGQVAFPGKAWGKVRIIRSRQDLSTFKTGEILIAPMTDPSYLSIMKRAAAFVTNEGGVLCHAAIVARELKKPCVIGTKHATHIFKDGDRVEVDAEKGIVRKL